MNRIFLIVKRGIQYMLNGTPNKIVQAKVTYTLPSEKLKGRNIIITGGGKGLGFAMAKRFLAEGANVLVSGRNEKQLKSAANEIGCKYLLLDVQNVVSFTQFFLDAESLLGGPIDFLVNNAGISLHEDGFQNVTVDTFDSQISTNFRGAFFMSQKYVERYHANNISDGKILFVSSETSVTADDRPYGLTKAAINSLVQGLAFKYIKEGIRVNAIAPGIVSTDMTGLGLNGNLYIGTRGSGRVLLPDEIAEVASFMLSDAANTINGQILLCNEGNMINARWK